MPPQFAPYALSDFALTLRAGGVVGSPFAHVPFGACLPGEVVLEPQRFGLGSRDWFGGHRPHPSLAVVPVIVGFLC